MSDFRLYAIAAVSTSPATILPLGARSSERQFRVAEGAEA